MRKIILATLFCSFFCSLLFSCGNSPHKNYYYLNTLPTEPKKTDAATENITQVIGVGPIEIPDYLNRSQIVFNQTNNGNSNNTLVVSDSDYWAEPLEKGIARVIALDLLQRNNNRSFIHFPWRTDNKPIYSLRVQINSLTRTDDEASIIATWELMDNNTKENLQRRNFIRTIPVASGAKNLTQAYSKLLDDLAAEMDGVLRKIMNDYSAEPTVKPK